MKACDSDYWHRTQTLESMAGDCFSQGTIEELMTSRSNFTLANTFAGRANFQKRRATQMENSLDASKGARNMILKTWRVKIFSRWMFSLTCRQGVCRFGKNPRLSKKCLYPALLGKMLGRSLYESGKYDRIEKGITHRSPQVEFCRSEIAIGKSSASKPRAPIEGLWCDSGPFFADQNRYLKQRVTNAALSSPFT